MSKNLPSHISAGCVVVKEKDGKNLVLLIFQRWNENNFGWTLPKGTVESGETPQQAAFRETVEETGVVGLKIVKEIHTTKFNFALEDGVEREKTVHWFLAYSEDVRTSQRRLSEHERRTQEKVEWFEINEAIKIAKFDEAKDLLRKVLQILE